MWESNNLDNPAGEEPGARRRAFHLLIPFFAVSVDEPMRPSCAEESL